MKFRMTKGIIFLHLVPNLTLKNGNGLTNNSMKEIFFVEFTTKGGIYKGI